MSWAFARLISNPSPLEHRFDHLRNRLDKLGRLRQISLEAAIQGAHTEYVYSHPASGDSKVEIFHRTPSPVVELAPG